MAFAGLCGRSSLTLVLMLGILALTAVHIVWVSSSLQGHGHSAGAVHKQPGGAVRPFWAGLGSIMSSSGRQQQSSPSADAGRQLDPSPPPAGGGASPSQASAKPSATREIRPVFSIPEPISFDGKRHQTHPKMVTNDFTVTLQFKTTAKMEGAGSPIQWHGGHGLVDNELDGVKNDFGISFKKGFVMFGIGNPDTTISSKAGLDDGKWHTVVASRRAVQGEFTLWVDGVQQGTERGKNNRFLMDNNDLVIGSVARLPEKCFVGDMRRIMIYDVFLTADEIRDANDQGVVRQEEKTFVMVQDPEYEHRQQPNGFITSSIVASVRSMASLSTFLFDLDADLWGAGRSFFNFVFDVDVADL